MAAPAGCLLTRATLSCPPSGTAVTGYLDRSRRDRVAAMRKRFATAADDGEPLPSDDHDTLALHYDAPVQSLAVRAMEGATRPALLRTVDLTMTAWDALTTR